MSANHVNLPLTETKRKATGGEKYLPAKRIPILVRAPHRKRPHATPGSQNNEIIPLHIAARPARRHNLHNHGLVDCASSQPLDLVAFAAVGVVVGLLVRDLDRKAVGDLVGQGCRLEGIAHVGAVGGAVGAPAVGADAGVAGLRAVALVADADGAALVEEIVVVGSRGADGLAAVFRGRGRGGAINVSLLLRMCGWVRAESLPVPSGVGLGLYRILGEYLAGREGQQAQESLHGGKEL